MASPHSVVHRKSLAYRMFVTAAEARDVFLGNENVGDFSATLQKYFTGISLPRYLVLVCIEYPLVLLISALTWCVAPATLVYILVRIIHSHSVGEISFTGGVGIFGLLILLTLFVTFFLLLLWGSVLKWAEQPPNALIRYIRGKVFRPDHVEPEYARYPEKFPGPIALLKKWILSIGGPPGTSQITWDSGRSREDTW
jgi:hypothetical protein